MKKIIIPLIFIALASCKTSVDKGFKTSFLSKKDWTTLFKKRVITLCLRESGLNLDKDNSGAIQFEIFGANPWVMREMDSLGKVYAKKILEAPSYFEGKPITNMALTIYTSDELDKIANNSYKRNLKKLAEEGSKSN